MTGDAIPAPPEFLEPSDRKQLRCIVMCNIGTCQWILNELEAADDMFRKVLEIEPEHAIAKSSLKHVRDNYCACY